MASHLQNQTDDKHKSHQGLGVAKYFREVPTMEGQKMEILSGVTYTDAEAQLAVFYGFKWMPQDAYEKYQASHDACSGTKCDDKCPGDCYCSGYQCYD